MYVWLSSGEESVAMYTLEVVSNKKAFSIEHCCTHADQFPIVKFTETTHLTEHIEQSFEHSLFRQKFLRHFRERFVDGRVENGGEMIKYVHRTFERRR